MAYPSAHVATAAEIATYGHVAATLRAYLDRFGIRAADLAQMAGYNRGYSGSSTWINGYGAPSRAAGARLAKAIGVPVECVVRRRLHEPSVAVPDPAGFKPPPWMKDAPVATATPPSRQALTVVSPGPAAAGAVLGTVQGLGSDRLGFRLHDDGTVTVQLNVRLEADHGTRVLRALLDMGLNT